MALFCWTRPSLVITTMTADTCNQVVTGLKTRRNGPVLAATERQSHENIDCKLSSCSMSDKVDGSTAISVPRTVNSCSSSRLRQHWSSYCAISNFAFRISAKKNRLGMASTKGPGTNGDLWISSSAQAASYLAISSLPTGTDNEMNWLRQGRFRLVPRLQGSNRER